MTSDWRASVIAAAIAFTVMRLYCRLPPSPLYWLMALLCICQSYEAVLPLSRDRMDNRVGLKACKRYRFKWVKPEALLWALDCVAAQFWREPHARLVGAQK